MSDDSDPSAHTGEVRVNLAGDAATAEDRPRPATSDDDPLRPGLRVWWLARDLDGLRPEHRARVAESRARRRNAAAGASEPSPYDDVVVLSGTILGFGPEDPPSVAVRVDQTGAIERARPVLVPGFYRARFDALCWLYWHFLRDVDPASASPAALRNARTVRTHLELEVHARGRAVRFGDLVIEP